MRSLRTCPRVTVEPVIFLYAYGLFMHLPVMQQYIYMRVSVAQGFPYSTSSKKSCEKLELNKTLEDIERKVGMCRATLIDTLVARVSEEQAW